MTLREWISAALLLLGAGFVLTASLGLLRLPDFYLRMSATTKAATLGLGLIMLATAVYYWDIAVTSRAIATILFLFLTAPVAAHRLARAAYFDGEPLTAETAVDELSGHYDRGTHLLEAPDEG